MRQNTPEAEGLKDGPFQLSKNTKSTSIEFLQENDVELSTWISEADESPLVQKCLRLWFTLCRQYNKEPWCQHPGEDFYPNAKVVLLTEAQQLCKLSQFAQFIAPFITKCIDDLDFSEETLFRVGTLLRALFEDP